MNDMKYNVKRAYKLLNEFLSKHNSLNDEAVSELEAIITILDEEMKNNENQA